MYRHFTSLMLVATLLATVLLSNTVASAQEVATQLSGITVTGHGEASAPADSATLQLVVGTEAYGPPQAPQPGATPGAREREEVAPVVESLVDLGVPEDEIEIVVGPYLSDIGTLGGPAVALLQFDLSDPDSRRIKDVIDAAIVGAAESRLIVGQVGVTFHIEDCAALERDAREAAIADAREQAGVQAELLDVTLGDLLASRDVPSGSEAVFGIYGPIPSETACSPLESSDVALLTFGSPPFNPNAEAEVTVYADIELTFDMAGGGEATPAP